VVTALGALSRSTRPSRWLGASNAVAARSPLRQDEHPAIFADMVAFKVLIR
jgi:hypothetical protein